MEVTDFYPSLFLLAWRAWDLNQSPLPSTQASPAVTVGTRMATPISVRCDRGWDVRPNSESLPSDIYSFRQTNQAEISHAYLWLDEAIYLVVLELPGCGRNWFPSLEKFCRYWGFWQAWWGQKPGGLGALGQNLSPWQNWRFHLGLSISASTCHKVLPYLIRGALSSLRKQSFGFPFL